MSKSIFSAAAAALFLAAMASTAPVHAKTVIICNDEGCAPAEVVQVPVLVVQDDD